ncbi:MAG: PAS domain S-box protein, partial [Acidobacteriota bacterium]
MSDQKTDGMIQAAALRQIADLAPLGIVTTDAELVIRGWNPWLEERSGLSAGDVTGRNLFEVYPDLRERKLDRYYEDALSGQTRILSHDLHSYLLPMAGRAGEFDYMPQSAQIAPLIERDSVAGTITIIEDVTERVRLEAALKNEVTELEQKIAALYQSMSESESRYRILSEQSLLGVYVIQDGKFRYANPAFARMFGYEPEEMIDLIDPFDIVFSADRERLAYAIKSRLSGDNDPNSRVFRGIRKDKTICYVESFGTRVTYNDRPAVLGTLLDITERKRADEERRKNEERFQLVAQATNDAVWDWDLVTNDVWWNEGVTTLFGYDAEQVGPDADWWSKNIHPQDKERIISSVHEVINSGGQFWTGEYRYRRADGTYAFVMDRGYVMRDDEGRPVRMVGAMADLTERRMAEEILRASEERFSKAFHSNPCLMSILTAKEGIYIDVNEAFTRSTGFTREDLIGRAAEDVGIWADEEGRQTVLRLLREQGFVRDLDVRFRRKSGEVIDGLFSAEKIRIGGQTCVMSTCIDITEQKRAQEALRRSEEYFRSLIENSQDIIRILDKHGTVIYTSPSVERVLGYKPEEQMGLHTSELVHPDDFDFTIDALNRLIENPGASEIVQCRVRHADGSWRVMEGMAKNLLDNPAVRGIILNSRDITERKRAEEKARQGEERYRSLFENNPLPAWVFDVETLDFLAVNDSAVEHYGYSREEFLSMKTSEIRPQQEVSKYLN